MYTRTLSLCAAFAITGAGLFAMASPAMGRDPVIVEAPRTDVITTRVSFSDLNLASTQGERRLHRRVGSAVDWVCSETVPNLATLEYKGCRTFAWDGARPQINQAVLRAREIAATGHSSIAASAIVLTFPK